MNWSCTAGACVVYLADPQLWVPFDDGTAFAQWIDHDRTLAALRGLGISAARYRRVLRL